MNLLHLSLWVLLWVHVQGKSQEENRRGLQNVIDRMTFLEQKVNTLEERTLRMEEHLASAKSKVAALEEKMRRFDTLEENRQKNKSVLRSCDEIHAFDPSKASGQYRIDPDGALIGDDPFRVQCNMSTGATYISHDSGELSDVDSCLGRGCFHRRNINYNATLRQITALIRLSRQCVQHFYLQFDCSSDSFDWEYWWNDRNKAIQPFYNCSRRSVSVDQCQWSCQVQSSISELPITRLIMGRQSFSTDAPSDAGRKLAPGKFALGKLECTGRMEGSEGLQGPVGPPGPPGPKGNDGEACSPGTTGGGHGGSDGKMCPADIGRNTTCFTRSTGCYCLVLIRQNWEGSLRYCSGWQMELVSIETAEEQQILVNLLAPIDYNYWWTSGSDEKQEGRWTWTATGEDFTFSNWAEGQPNGGPEQNYMQLIPFHENKWWDLEMTDLAYSVCES